MQVGYCKATTETRQANRWFHSSLLHLFFNILVQQGEPIAYVQRQLQALSDQLRVGEVSH